MRTEKRKMRGYLLKFSFGSRETEDKITALKRSHSRSPKTKNPETIFPRGGEGSIGLQVEEVIRRQIGKLEYTAKIGRKTRNYFRKKG